MEIVDSKKRSRTLEPLAEQEIAGEVLVEKYAKGDERNAREVRRRVARALAAVEAPEKRDFWEQKFL
jgi:ribonucleoside-diphosphate reductase alpha chain